MSYLCRCGDWPQPSTLAQPDLSCRNAIDRQERGHQDKEIDPIDVVLDSEPLRIQSLASLSGRNRELAKTGLMLALGVRRTDPDQTKINTMATIRQNGRQKVDWSGVFITEGHYSQSNERWMVTLEDFRLRVDANTESSCWLTTPTVSLSPALSIPCLSFAWLNQPKPSQFP